MFVVRAIQDKTLQKQICSIVKAEYKENALLALDLIDRLLKTVPVYHLSCTPTLDAVDVCFREMIK